MAKFPSRSSRQIQDLLSSHGFAFKEQARHGEAWARELPGRPVIVPRNRRAIPGGTVQAILREAGITRAQAFAFWGIH